MQKLLHVCPNIYTHYLGKWKGTIFAMSVSPLIASYAIISSVYIFVLIAVCLYHIDIVKNTQFILMCACLLCLCQCICF